MRRAKAALLVAFLVSAPTITSAQSLRGAQEWLPPGSLSLDALSLHPREALEGGEAPSFYVALGRLAFRSPDILGGTARKAGLSCHACHTNGYSNTDFFIPGLSDRPGHVDVTHSFWNVRADDRQDNPLAIPSLRGVKTKERLGQDLGATSLREFTRRVIVVDFAGDEPEPVLLDALVAYQEALRPVPLVDEPVSLEQDMRDILHHLDALALPLSEEDAALAARMATMIRGQLGFIDERFPDDEAMRDVHAILADWSRALANIADLAENDDWPAARSALATLRTAVADPPPVFADQAPLSLYNPIRLKAWLSKPIR
jgi:hypothetical protein